MKCIRCGAEISDDSQACMACGLEFDEEMRKQMLDYKAQMEEYNRQMEEYNQKMEEYKRRQQYAQPDAQPDVQQYAQPQPEMQSDIQQGAQSGVQQYAQPQSGMRQDMQQQAGPQQYNEPQPAAIPNIPAMLAALVCLTSVFLPYADGKVTASIWDAAGIPLSLLFLIPAAAIVVLSFICKKPVKIINFVICVLYSGLTIFEFVLTLVNIKTEDYGTLSYGAYVSIISAVIVLISVPVWSLITKPKKVRA